MRRRRGSAAVELVAIAPMLALFLAIAVQLVVLFHRELAAVAAADASAARALRAWEEETRGAGSHRPCLEELSEQAFRGDAPATRIGVGSLSVSVGVPEEVHLVGQPVCVP